MKLKSPNPNNSNTSEASSGMASFFLVHVPPLPNTHQPQPSKKPTTFTSGHHLLSKAQSTISICVLLLLLSLLLFTLSTFEPTTTTTMHNHRRKLTFIKLRKRPLTEKLSVNKALQGMGTLYKRGTRSMHGLIICHLTESVTDDDVSLFLRLFFRSSLYTKFDILFIFNSGSALVFDNVIRTENDLFLNLLTRFKKLNGSDENVGSSFGGVHFVKMGEKGRQSDEIIWGKRVGNVRELTRLSYGSVIGFEVDELDSENSLRGFMDHVPMSLRRWACYTMLLGRVSGSFKNVVLVDLKEVLLLGDPLGRVNNKSPESIYLSTFPNLSKHGRKNSELTQVSVSPSIIFGGARGIRRLANAMLIEIVRTAMQRKRKNSVSESGVLSQLVKNEYFLKNVKLTVTPELTPEASLLNSAGLLSNYTVLRRGNNNNIDVYGKFMKYVCSSFPLDSLVYHDC